MRVAKLFVSIGLTATLPASLALMATGWDYLPKATMTSAPEALADRTASSPQFTVPELAERSRWEAFLKEARVVSAEHLGADQGITEPWKLLLEKDGVTCHGLWKNPSGTQLGFLEGWKFEVAAYELDKLLGIGMVPPTVEKRFRGMIGSCQLWIEDTILLMDRLTDSPGDPFFYSTSWKRVGYIAQLFDNLIGNEDRHARNILITPDNRGLLIDHSRTFRSTKAFTEDIPFTERKMAPGDIMRELPRTLVDRVRALSESDVKAVLGKYLTSREIRAVMARRVLLLEEVDRLVAKYGADSVLY